jgi:hypothetical protein
MFPSHDQVGGIITQGAGKVGGQVIQRGRSSQVLKQKGRPVIRRGSVNQPPRSKLGAIASTWRDLSSADRDTWSSLALTLVRYNRFGVAYVPTAYQVFLELNSNLQNFGSQAIIETAPAPPNFPAVDSWSLDVDPSSSEFIVNWNQSAGDVDFRMYVSLYPLQSLGNSFVRGSARLTAASALVSAETVNAFTEIIKRWPWLTGGSVQVAIAVDGVQTGTGWRMPRVQLMAPFSNP